MRLRRLTSASSIAVHWMADSVISFIPASTLSEQRLSQDECLNAFLYRISEAAVLYGGSM